MLIYPQGCSVILTDDFTQKALQDCFFPIPRFSVSLIQCHSFPSSVCLESSNLASYPYCPG